MALGFGFGLGFGRQGGGEPPPPSFLPSDLSGLAMWHAADDPSTIIHVSGSVSAWNDKSGNGRNFTQDTGARQPVTGSTTIKGRNVLVGNGSSTCMTQAAFITALSAKTIFVVLGGNAQVSGCFLSERQVAGGNPNIQWSSSNSAPGAEFRTYYRNNGNSDMISSVSSNTLMDGTAKVLTIADNKAAYKAWINGSLGTDITYTFGATTVDLLGIFANPRIPSGFFNGWKAELIVYDRILNDTERGQVETYLSGRWV